MQARTVITSQTVKAIRASRGHRGPWPPLPPGPSLYRDYDEGEIGRVIRGVPEDRIEAAEDHAFRWGYLYAHPATSAAEFEVCRVLCSVGVAWRRLAEIVAGRASLHTYWAERLDGPGRDNALERLAVAEVQRHGFESLRPVGVEEWYGSARYGHRRALDRARSRWEQSPLDIKQRIWEGRVLALLVLGWVGMVGEGWTIPPLCMWEYAAICNAIYLLFGQDIALPAIRQTIHRLDLVPFLSCDRVGDCMMHHKLAGVMRLVYQTGRISDHHVQPIHIGDRTLVPGRELGLQFLVTRQNRESSTMRVDG